MIITNRLLMKDYLALVFKEVFMVIVQGAEVKIQAICGNLNVKFKEWKGYG